MLTLHIVYSVCVLSRYAVPSRYAFCSLFLSTELFVDEFQQEGKDIMSKRKIEGTEQDDDSRTRCSSVGQHLLTDVKMDGLIFVSKINHRNRCFIPSTKNYFAGVQVKKVLVDSGCSSILLPIEENSLDSLFLRFPSDVFIASIGGSPGVGDGSLVLLFSYFSRSSFEVKLCQDLVGHAEPLTVKNLRFSLCSEDSAAILESPGQLK
jgi:hypothetical protein